MTDVEQITTAHDNAIDLVEFGKKLRGCVKSGANGPLIIANDVVALSNNWSAYKHEAGGITCTQWLIGICGAGKGLAFWKRLDSAVQRIGEESRRQLDYRVALYVSNNVSDEHLRNVFKMLISNMKENGGNPLTLKQATRRIAAITGKTPGKKTCACCRKYEQLLIKHGIDPNEMVD